MNLCYYRSEREKETLHVNKFDLNVYILEVWF